MSVIKCQYKNNNICNSDGENKTTIKEIEERLDVICCKNCHWICSTYTGNDFKKVFFSQYNRIKKIKDAKYLEDFMFIYGHYSETINDMDSITYDVYSIKLMLLKKHKNLRNSDICRNVYLCKKLGIRIPKSIYRKYKRINKHLKEYEKEFINYINTEINRILEED